MATPQECRGFHANGSTRDMLSPENTKQSKSLEISSNVNILQEYIPCYSLYGLQMKNTPDLQIW
jgi:hypothetical protein